MKKSLVNDERKGTKMLHHGWRAQINSDSCQYQPGYFFFCIGREDSKSEGGRPRNGWKPGSSECQPRQWSNCDHAGFPISNYIEGSREVTWPNALKIRQAGSFLGPRWTCIAAQFGFSLSIKRICQVPNCIELSVCSQNKLRQDQARETK